MYIAQVLDLFLIHKSQYISLLPTELQWLCAGG